MQLRDWTPHLEVQDVGGGLSYAPALRFVAILQCECGHLETVPTRAHRLDHVPLTTNIDWKVTELARGRYCSKCAVASGLPPEDKRRLKEEALSQVTESWVEMAKRKYNLISP